MTDIDNLIAVHGENFTVSQVSDGAVDSYGDPAPTWTTAATEKVWIQDPSVSMRDNWLKIIDSSIGKMDTRDFVAFLLSTSVIAQGYVVTSASSVRYDVRRVFTAKLFGNASHKIAILRKSEDA